MENDCIFCKIINNEIPSTTIYEDSDIKVFLDISQTTPGHTLMVPKKHVENIFQYDEKLAQKVLTKIPTIARAIRQSDPQIKGMNIVNNNGHVAYQSVFHSHIHFIPRYAKDDTFEIDFKDNSNQYTQQQLDIIAAKIRANLEA